MKIERKHVLILLSIVVMIAIASNALVTTYASEEDNDNSYLGWFNGNMPKCRFGGGQGWGQRGFIEVSEEYEAKVIEIAENDVDVANLINTEGYTVAGIRPIFTIKVDAEGNVETKATDAILTLTNEDATSRASIWVDLEELKVTRIVIETRTVIEKS